MVARELRRSVRSVKGIIIGILTLLGAFVASLVCVWMEGNDRDAAKIASTDAYIEIKKAAIEKATGDAAFEASVREEARQLAGPTRLKRRERSAAREHPHPPGRFVGDAQPSESQCLTALMTTNMKHRHGGSSGVREGEFPENAVSA